MNELLLETYFIHILVTYYEKRAVVHNKLNLLLKEEGRKRERGSKREREREIERERGWERERKREREEEM